MAETSTSVVKDESEESMTLVDFLEEELQLENDANAVLGPSDDKNCTYSKGYVQRQALYACKTCATPPNTNPAGVCLACSYHCHEGHDLVELYTKRFFRCDCGNSKFGKKCNLEPEKTELNEKNVYNQNFRGLYCTCSRPYPDPDDSVSDEMLQCVICEDWYHTRHLNSTVPSEENYAEMICGPCTDKLPFLLYYLGNAVTKVEAVEDKSSVDVKLTQPNAEDEANKATVPVPSCVPDTKECLLKNLIRLERAGQGATFWPGNFRTLICRCGDCQETYGKLGVPWIIDENDTVQSYEEIGKQGLENGAKPTQYEQGMKALSEMDRVSQVEAIQNYNDLKSELSAYLSKFAENKKVVREEDIHEFFSQMQARKRQRIGTPPYMCH